MSSSHQNDRAASAQSQGVELAQYGQLEEVVEASPSQRVRLQPPKGLRRLRLHLGLLLLKNWIITKRNLRNTIFLLFMPILTVLTLILWQSIIDRMTVFEIREPDLIPSRPIQKCIPPLHSPDKSCTTIAYSVIGPREAWIDYVMEYVAVTNGLEFGSDVSFVSDAKTPKAFDDYLLAHPNRTKLGVVFCTSEWPIEVSRDSIGVPGSSKNESSAKPSAGQKLPDGVGDGLNLEVALPCRFDELAGKQLVFYSMYWNWTLNWRSPYLQDFKASYGKDADAVRLKTSIDNALFALYAAHGTADAQQVVGDAAESQRLLPRDYTERLNVIVQDYPKMTSRFAQGYDMASFNGAIYFFVPIMLHFIMSVNEILREKEKRLRQGITVMGMSHGVYWVSWIATAAAMTAVLVATQLVVCAAFGFPIVLKTPVPINFALYFLFGMSFQAIGIFLTTVCTDVKNGYTAAYGFLLLSLIMEAFLTTNFFVDYMYMDGTELYVRAVRAVFSLYPAFHYSKAFGDISFLAGTYFDMAEGRWKQGDGYAWADLFREYSGKLVTAGGVRTFTEPSTFASLSYIVADTALFLALAWYFDHVLPGNRGTVESPFFVCSLDYWRARVCGRKRHIGSGSGVGAFGAVPPDAHESVKAETQRVLAHERDARQASGLRVLALSKTYHKYPFGIRSARDVHALADVHLEVQQGEILAILGHNGAGKSTLINVLTGILSPSGGTARVLDHDIYADMDRIRTLMGVCPQFDILWDELTADEHLRMYCLLKGVADADVETEVRARLQQVEMLAYRKARISTLSGGQKRRISIAISAIGDPRIIYLDEPTTGMDPKTRRSVWKMIKELKRGRSIILTTHGMDEADALADRIAVIAEGTLRCIGSSLYLKNNFGDGYRLTLVADPHHTLFLRRQVQALMPSARILDDAGGSFIVCVPVRQQGELKALLKILEADPDSDDYARFTADEHEMRKAVQNFGLSHSTLEEVFMKITKKNSRYF